jgi:hypothetical protein
MLDHQPKVTLTVPLLGGQNRLRQMILYVAKRCEEAEFFGGIKLNKIIWKADFDSYADRQVPVTGREYRRRKFGPALREMLPVHTEMLKDGLIRIERRDFGDDVIEKRTIALVEPDLTLFSETDLQYVLASIRHYWDKTGTESSDESHGIAWRTRHNGDPMPYELSFLSDEPIDRTHRARIAQLIHDKGWISG